MSPGIDANARKEIDRFLLALMAAQLLPHVEAAYGVPRAAAAVESARLLLAEVDRQQGGAK
jgi:hypothetical protein